MDANKLIGVVNFKVRHIPSQYISITKIEFEDRGDQVYYCWTVCDISGQPIATKCLGISNKIIKGDRLHFSINHSKYGIDNYRINRQKVFEVIEEIKV